MLEIVGRYIEDLMALQRAIRWDEADALFERFKSAQAIRREVVRAGQAYKRVPSARYQRSGSVRHLSQTAESEIA